MFTEGESLPGGYAFFVPLSRWSVNSVNGQRFNEGHLMIAGPGSDFLVAADGANECTIPNTNPMLAAWLSTLTIDVCDASGVLFAA